MNKKVFNSVDLTLDEGSRTVVCVINSDSVDRQGEVVEPSGLIKANYNNNPVVMADHNYTISNIIGRCLWIKPDSADPSLLLAKWYCTDKTQIGRDAWALMSEAPPILNAFSIGFNVLDSGPPTLDEIDQHPQWAMAKSIIRKWELLEFSAVCIPANPDALMVARSKGVSQETINLFPTEGDRGTEAPQTKSCWRFDDPADLAAVAAIKQAELAPVVAPPRPTYCKRFDPAAIREKIQSADLLYKKLKGQA